MDAQGPVIRERGAGLAEWAFVAAMLAVYLFIACTHIKRPGINYDEVTYGNVALGGVDPLNFIEHTITVMGKPVHTMTMPYIGSAKAYLYMPIFKLFGISPLTIRLPAILLGALSLVFTYFFVKRTLNKGIAQAALALAATDPSLVFHTRLDWGPVDIMLLLKMASLYYLAVWVQTKKTGYLALGALLNGLAMYNETTFIWYLAGMGVAVLLVYRRELFRYLTPKNLAVASLFFILGAGLLLQYNIAVGFRPFRQQEYVSWATVASVPYEAGVFVDTLNGSALYERINEEPFRFGLLSRENRLLRGNLMALLFLAAAPLVLWQRRERWIKVLVISVMVLVAQMFLILKAGSSHHFMLGYPFPLIVVAWAAFQVGERLRARFKPAWRPPVVARIAMLGLLPVLIANLYSDFLYVRSFMKIGGRGVWSDAIYDLAAFTQARPDRRFVLIEWGLNNQLLLLSGGTSRLEEICWAIASADYQPELRRRLQDPSNIYVAFAPAHQIWPETARFHETVKRLGLQEKVYKIFQQRDGRPVYMLYEVVQP